MSSTAEPRSRRAESAKMPRRRASAAAPPTEAESPANASASAAPVLIRLPDLTPWAARSASESMPQDAAEIAAATAEGMGSGETTAPRGTEGSGSGDSRRRGSRERQRSRRRREAEADSTPSGEWNATAGKAAIGGSVILVALIAAWMLWPAQKPTPEQDDFWQQQAESLVQPPAGGSATAVAPAQPREGAGQLEPRTAARPGAGDVRNANYGGPAPLGMPAPNQLPSDPNPAPAGAHPLPADTQHFQNSRMPGHGDGQHIPSQQFPDSRLQPAPSVPGAAGTADAQGLGTSGTSGSQLPPGEWQPVPPPADSSPQFSPQQPSPQQLGPQPSQQPTRFQGSTLPPSSSQPSAFGGSSLEKY